MSAAPQWFDQIGLFFEATVERGTVTEICSVLSNERRQFVILYLLDNDEPWVRTAEISRWIAAIEQDVSAEQATGPPYHRVRTSLIQNHLDTLSRQGIIRYDADRNRFQQGPMFRSAARVLLLLCLMSSTFGTAL